MQPGARLQAAIEVLAEILNRHRPAAQALSDWGRAHRFAGSGDRAAIGNIVFDALRKRNSLSFLMGAETPRALALGVLAHAWGEAAEVIDAMCAGGRAPEPLSEAERAGLIAALDPDAPDWVRGNYPEWMADEFRAAFGAEAVAQGAALAERAPVDVRVNTLKADRAKVMKALREYAPEETPFSPVGVRVPVRARHHKAPKIEADAAHGKGWFEVQDEGSQIAALLAGAGPRHQVADVCAGAGGKTLALAAQMENTGQIYAYDADKTRLRPIFERLKRAGARNVQVLPAGNESALEELRERMDIVFVDAPCSGSGAWRRRPDAKWRLSPQALEKRHAEQRAVLAQSAPLVKPGGWLVYVTCSVLPSENDAQAAWFLAEYSDFAPVPLAQVWRETLSASFPGSAATGNGDSLLLTPASHGTDGFFIAILQRSA
ncbi:RsmB/NOP family class I SAM-dependent RNA methyltransferase [Dichotomicrobium thermohalophilum]|uniref:16S rRNA (Cytosine967-C5)-methyltransferase n=1 Tax=Dichotomicrobium thermohalophilum TaxID=933063 RepID=A0A397Q6B9_9HYPH|nr:RsmB/NOP family class I SAM-dependent RNA methyltransferase [Dichotomicrobium thermohalophilum]RIA56632.1 16S rRNA (cytosine967-C5)-methyltransferase [Dichotomicrobium thermohalophilum]